MARLLSTLKSNLNLLIRDKTNGTIEASDAQTLFNIGIDRLKNKHEFPGTKQRADLDVFNGVFEYATPSGYKSGIDFRVNEDSVDWEKRSSKEFWHDRQYKGDIWADDNYNDTRILLINRRTNKGDKLLHNCDSLTADGTWAIDATTDALNLTIDAAEYKTSSGALNFDFDVSVGAGDAATITNSTMTAIDLSGHEEKSRLFMWVYFPDVTNISSVALKWGSSSANYWSVTATTAHNGMSFRTGWNHLSFAWNGATETGTGVSTGIDYLSATINYSASQGDDTDFRIDDIRSILPERIEVDYYSSNFVKTTAGAFQSEFSADSDVTILEDNEDIVLLYLAAAEAFRILRDLDDSVDMLNKAGEQLGEIIQDKPSEEEKATDTYYFM